jgi:hypothetical protein
MEQCVNELEDDLERLGALKRRAARLLHALRQAECLGESRQCCLQREQWFMARQAVHALNQHVEHYIRFRLPPMLDRQLK